MALFTRNTTATAPAAPAPGSPITPGGEQLIAPLPSNAAPARPAPRMIVSNERQTYFQQMKVRIHQKLVERLDMQNLRTLPPETVRGEVRALIRDLCQSEKGLINGTDQERLMDDVMDETFGLGPLETLLKDPTISDILINRFDRIYCEKRGRLEMS